MQNILKGQTAIVTGGTAGIGKAIALRFAEQGARVAVIGTNESRGNAVIEEINKKFPENPAQFYQVDVSNHEASRMLLKKY